MIENKQSGSLPDYWARLTNLKATDVSNNSLSGQLSSTWVAMRDAKPIDFSGNKYTGERNPAGVGDDVGANYKLQCPSVYGNPYMASSGLKNSQGRYQ